MNITLSKRQKYGLFSILAGFSAYYFSLDPISRGIGYAVLILVFVTLGNFLTHTPNIKVFSILITSVLHYHLVIGTFLSYHYFPNLSLHFKVASALIFTVLFYITSLVNNVFLVIDTRSEVIPLYRVAATWSKILIIAIAIPFLAGVYKLPFYTLLQGSLATTSVLLFLSYLLWLLKLSPDTKKYKAGEVVTLLGFGSFSFFVLNIAVSFFPSESFLRALFLSSVLMFNASYIEGHFKNKINTKLITEHLVISFLFLLLLFVFKP